MKTLIFSFLLILATAVAHAQQITELEEARVGFAPLNVEVIENGDNFTYKVHESFAGEFVKDPIAFMKANFNIKNFIDTHKEQDYDSYDVTFKSEQGYLSANFDKDGELVKTQQRFKDIPLPLDVRRELYMANKGWTMTENKFIAAGRGEILEKQLYKIKMEKGNLSRKVKLDGTAFTRASVASNN